MMLVAVLKVLKKLRDWVLDILFEFMLFILWLLLFLLRTRELNKSKHYTLGYILDSFDCLRCPVHCSEAHQKSIKLVKQIQTLSKSSSHPVNLPVPPLKSRTKKPTRLQIARYELQEELNKPSNKVNIKRVKELYKIIDALEDRWRKRSTAQKAAGRRKKQMANRKTWRRSVKTSYQDHPSENRTKYQDDAFHALDSLQDVLESRNSQKHAPTFATVPEKISKSFVKSKSRKLTRLQIVRNVLDRELAKSSRCINIDRVKELEKKKQRLEQEYHNRSRAQRQAWRWRKRRDEIVEGKAINDVAQSVKVFGHIKSPTSNEKTCLRCPVHCLPVKNIRGHWKNRLYKLLISIFRQLDAKNSFKELRGTSVGRTFKCKNKARGGFIIFFLRKMIKWINRKWFQDICVRK